MYGASLPRAYCHVCGDGGARERSRARALARVAHSLNDTHPLVRTGQTKAILCLLEATTNTLVKVIEPKGASLEVRLCAFSQLVITRL